MENQFNQRYAYYYQIEKKPKTKVVKLNNTFTDLYLNDRKIKRIKQLEYESVNYYLLDIIFLQSTLFSFIIPGFIGIGNIMFSFVILAIG